MMAPIFKKLAKEIGQDKAVFVKIDTNTQYELSSRFQVRSLPTFMFFLNHKVVDQFSGAGEQQLRQMTQSVVRQSEIENVVLSEESLIEYYKQVDATKDSKSISSVYQKCVDMNKKHSHECVGSAANQLARKLKKKYKSAPKLTPRFTEEDRKPGDKEPKGEEKKKKTSSRRQEKLTLESFTKEELLKELERREDEERDAEVETEEDDDEETELFHRWVPGPFPERVVIIGGGPAGTSAAIYASRAGLQPLVICPPMGGQLQGKGVVIENYSGVADVNMTGPALIAAMRMQAASFGALWEDETVLSIDASQRPFKVITNSSEIETHSIIVATGAESNWLNVTGEWELRGGGVSSCATCDGAIYRGKDVVVVGGGDAAMEDALVLARLCRSVTVIHRRDTFRASKILAKRVMEHPHISILWNTKVKEIVGEALGNESDESDQVDLDDQQAGQKAVKEVILSDTVTQEESRLSVDAVFVAIGHTPATSFLQGIVEFDEERPGYVKTFGGSTRTSVAGIFAAGDVSDSVYRQAITSAGSGAAAALDAERWLSEEGLGNEAAELEAELLADIMGTPDEKGPEYNAYEDAGARAGGYKETVAGGSEL
jgi:thioredoxin reductase (NADPH)